MLIGGLVIVGDRGVPWLAVDARGQRQLERLLGIGSRGAVRVDVDDGGGRLGRVQRNADVVGAPGVCARSELEPKEAAVVMRIFTSHTDGTPLTRTVKTLNEESVPAAIRAAKGWSPPTISRILDNENHAGRWIWNRTESRPDAKTGRRRRFDKPESEWIVREDEDLRIVPAPAMGGGARAPRAGAPHLAG